MSTIRSIKSAYFAAFIFGALIALALAVPARSAEPFRLDRVAIVRFTDIGEGKLRRQQGILMIEGRVQWRGSFDLPRPANTPDWALDRALITPEGWLSYYNLGFGAVDNFELTDGSVRFRIGEESYHFIAPRETPYLAAGRVINLSTRTRLAGNGDAVIAGFVIEDRPRTVLVRGIGPGLARFGVAQPAPNPFLSIKRNGQTILFNDDWNARPDADAVRQATARVGAFPLDEGSRDAAYLAVLAPGAYTVHVEPAAPNLPGGEVLIEIYSAPDQAPELAATTDSAAERGRPPRS